MRNPWSTVLGHSRQVHSLRASVAAGRLAQAYAFSGPAGIGKRLVAMRLAQCLFCQRHAETELAACGACSACRQLVAGTHPDLLMVGLPPGKRELSIELFVGSAEERGRAGLCYELALRPMAGRRRVAVIDDADSFNEESANCLLKTLEEPPRHALIILLVTNADLLLPTIRSRCQVVNFLPLSSDDVQTILLREGLADNAEAASSAAAMCEGSLEVARQLLEPGLREQRELVYSLLAAPQFDSSRTAARLVGAAQSNGAARGARHELGDWIVKFVVQFYRQALRSLAGGTSANDPHVSRFVGQFNSSTRRDVDRVAALLERAVLADEQLAGNVSVPLCLEALCADLDRLRRS